MKRFRCFYNHRRYSLFARQARGRGRCDEPSTGQSRSFRRLSNEVQYAVQYSPLAVHKSVSALTGRQPLTMNFRVSKTAFCRSVVPLQLSALRCAVQHLVRLLLGMINGVVKGDVRGIQAARRRRSQWPISDWTRLPIASCRVVSDNRRLRNYLPVVPSRYSSPR